MLIRTTTSTDYLSDTQQTILAGDVHAAMRLLVEELRQRRASASAQEWREHLDRCARHPLRDLLHHDPLTKRCYDKPRGYPGDAVMLDLVFGIRPLPAATRPLGREVFRFNFAAPCFQSVRARRQEIGSAIDRLSARRDDLSVLSVACGHVREAQTSSAVAEGRVGRFLGVDEDPLSVSVVEKELAPLGVRAVEGTLKLILQGRMPLGTFGLVYASGLYDHLIQPVAVALTGRLWQHVEPGGTLLIPTLTPDVREAGYLEAFMDWHMTYRGEEELEGVACGIDGKEIAETHFHRDPGGNVAFMEIQKR